MREALHILIEIIVALAAAMAFGTLVIALGALAAGAGLFALGWTALRWRRRRK